MTLGSAAARPVKSITRSLTRRLLVLSLIGVLGLGGTVALGLWVTLARVQQRMDRINLEACGSFDRFFLELQNGLKATSDGLADRLDQDRALAGLETRNRAFLDLCYLRFDGTIAAQRHALGRPRQTGIDQRSWLQAPPAYGQVLIGPVRFQGATPFVDLATPVTDGISLRTGLLVARVDLSALWNTTLDIRVGESGYACLVEDTGQLVAFRDRRLLERGSNLASRLGRTPQAIAAGRPSLYIGLDGRWVLGSARPLGSVPWFTLLEQPASEALLPFELLALGLLALLLLVGWMHHDTIRFARLRIVTPLLALRDAVGAMAEGDLSQSVALASRDELGQLAHSFNRMASQLQLAFIDQAEKIQALRKIELELQDALALLQADVAERALAEIDRAKLQAQLQQAQKMESLGSLAGGVAHDMNNVLGAVLALASAELPGHPPGSSSHTAFQTICQAAIRGGNMVRSLLSFARQSPSEQRELDMNQLLREQANLLRYTTLAQVRLELELAPDLRPLRGDGSALLHALMNLSVNAVDAMGGQGTLTLRTRNSDDRWLEVQVQDTGCGMPREVLARAMDPFFTTKPVGRGTGLGLSMVYSTVQANGGQVEIHSQPGQGTLVTLRFPACPASLPVAPVAALADPGSARKSLQVLLVDDDDLVRMASELLLRMLGHRATTAASGEQALLSLEAGHPQDLVILDLNMPGIGGAGTLPRLRILRPDLPVLLATGRADQTALNLVAAYPLVTLLPKPYSMEDLQAVLERI